MASSKRTARPDKDAFDRVIEEWRRERPDLDVSPIGIVGRLHVAGRRTERFYEESVAPFGLRPADFFLLSELRRSGPPYVLSPSDLSDLLVRSSGGITRQLDQLERSGWIRREPDPHDRRGVRVVLTDAGLELIDEALSAHFENEAQLLAPLSAAERDRIAGLLRELLGLLPRERGAGPPRLRSRSRARPRPG